MLCPRLSSFTRQWRAAEPDWHNGPVPVFADRDAAAIRLLIVGLAPGLRGANRTGRPFTGDHAGGLLFKTLLAHGFARGAYDARPDDGLVLCNAAIINAVRCVPPQNKPLPVEINTCRRFLEPAFGAFPGLRAVITLGAIAHASTVKSLGARLADHPFKHGGQTRIGALNLLPSYHCSRYNTNTGVLTESMFNDVFAAAARLVAA
jgi:uracil-DNA glycosylase